MDWRSLNNYLKTKIIIIAFSALVVVITFVFRWWFFASLNEFQKWYPSTGWFLWLGKSVVEAFAFSVIVWLFILFSLKTFQWLFGKLRYTTPVFIFFTVIVLGFTLNTHPFADYSMYIKFPNWSYVFIIEDLDGNLLPVKEYTNYSESDICDLYYNYLIERDVKYGGIESREIAEQAVKAISENIVFKKQTNGFRLVRLYYRIENRQTVETRDVLYERQF